MKKVLIIFSILLFNFKIKAQNLELPGQVYFFMGLEFPLVKVRDHGHSPLNYKGLEATFRLGHEEINPNFVSRISFSASIGSATPGFKSKAEQGNSSVDINNFQVSYAYYRLLGDYNTEGWNRYVGGAFTLHLDLRSYSLPSNNLFGFQANGALNLGGFVQKKLSDNWRFNYEAFTPVLTYAIRPNYVGMLPISGSDFSLGKILATGKWVTMNKLFRFYNRLSFDQQINDHRQRRIFYDWDFYSNTVSKPMQSVRSGVGYESLFKM